MKTLCSLCLLIFMCIKANAQSNSPCDVFKNNGFESVEAYFKDFKNALSNNIPHLRQTRQWARKNNRPEVELATNRLEYWAKKMMQAIDTNNGKNQESLCEKFEKERMYAGDFAQLSMMFLLTNGLSVNSVDYSKYK